MSVVPVHEGFYDVSFQSGTIERVRFSDRAWGQDVRLALGWRGLEVALSKDEDVHLRRRVSAYRLHIEQTHGPAMEAAGWLARFYAGKRTRIKAYRFYLIAHRLDDVRLRAYDKAWQARTAAHLGASRVKIDVEVDQFFSKRGGAPKKDMNPLGAQESWFDREAQALPNASE
ncbi:hypothetical protein [Paraburkholderia sp. RL17-337-BIB-A]|uniref:hypothetical protein n=1 Tax=Paraburkholderia sp. RL17-337-BIB-A TaxID=3031636 RepID=UPI0038BD534C